MRNLEGFVEKGFVPNECHQKDNTTPDFSIPGIGWRYGWQWSLGIGLVTWLIFGISLVPQHGMLNSMLRNLPIGLFFALPVHYLVALRALRRNRSYRLCFPKDSLFYSIYNDICEGNLNTNTTFLAKVINLYCHYFDSTPMEVLLSLNTKKDWEAINIMCWIIPRTSYKGDKVKREFFELLNKEWKEEVLKETAEEAVKI